MADGETGKLILIERNGGLLMQALKSRIPDAYIHLSKKTWEEFELLEKLFEDQRGVRLAYFQGTIEICMPGQDHEIFAEIIASLILVFCMTKRINFIPCGSMTQQKPGEASAQADKSYCFQQRKPIPDLSIEVTFTSGGPEKLARYQALGVQEVWFWEDEVFTLYRLRTDHYERIQQSEIPELQELDVKLLTRFVLMAETSLLKATEEFRAQLNGVRN
jgi:Uma2 family endonuclease